MIEKHQEYLEKLMDSGLDPFTKRRFTERYLYIQNICSDTAVEFEMIDRGVVVGDKTFSFD